METTDHTAVLGNHGYGRIRFPDHLREGKEITLEGTPFAALLAREPRPGEIITITDVRNKEFRGRITELGADQARCYIFEELAEPTEIPFDLFLFQALPDKERMELIIQKATELGVKVICSFKSRHSISLQEREAGQPKAHRWQHIALAASKQSRRAVVPWVAPYCSFEEALEQTRPLELKLILVEKEKERLATLIGNTPLPKTIALMVGPEGGWDAEEVEHAREKGFCPVGLGGRILRTETAAIAACAILQYAWDGP
ncbi:MAG: 16S rRNA (uracil(1498)-N(3))-methyltransferase [Deltaproteobacteria bacterium]|nr:16S rRNA (uracil(1498)-N(3))-methyltransferase [Deltaproteobacteria bacterium]